MTISKTHFVWGIMALAGLASWVGAAESNKVTIAEMRGEGKTVIAKLDGQGAIHVLRDSKQGPVYSKSVDHGKSFETPVSVVNAEAKKPGLEFQGWDLAVGQGGSVHVVMSTNAWKLKLPHEEWACFHARLAPGTQSFTPVQNVNRKPSEGFSLAANQKGDVTVCWLSGKLFANVSHDDGKTFAPAVEIDPGFNPCDCCTTSATYSADGRLAILYREETDNNRDMYLVLWDQSRHQVSRTRVSTTPWKVDACPMTYYSIVPHPDGFMAVWPTKRHIYFARLDLKGQLLSPAETQTPGTTGMRTGMLTLSNSAGQTLIAWKNDNQLHWQLYDSQAKPLGKPESIKSAGNGAAGVVTQEGQFILIP